jgi:hypothetical protein
MVDEFLCKAKAVEYAKSIAIKTEETHINIEGKALKV